MAIPVGAFKNNIYREVEFRKDAELIRNQQYDDMLAQNRECSDVLQYIVAAAFLNSEFSDFPSKIPLGSENGYRSESIIENRNGIWQLQRNDHLIHSTHRFHKSESVISPILKALKIDLTLESTKQLSDIFKSSNTQKTSTFFRDLISMIKPILPSAVMRAAFTQGPEILKLFHIPITNGTASTWILALKNEGIDCNQPILSVSKNHLCIPQPLIALIQNGSDNWDENETSIFMDALLLNGAEMEIKDQYGNTPLLEAAKFKNLNKLKFLINNDADIYATNNSRNGVLHLVLEQSMVNKHDLLSIVHFLIHEGADISSDNINGETPLSLFVDLSSEYSIGESSDDKSVYNKIYELLYEGRKNTIKI